jgi:DNA-binding NarL/FixJ family response regulator
VVSGGEWARRLRPRGERLRPEHHPPITVLIADDHPLLRDGMRRLLTAEGDLAVVAEVDTGDAVPAAVAESRPDVVLLDIGMPGPAYTRVVRDLVTRFPATRVIVVSGCDEREYAVPALRAGAAGFVSKANPSGELVAAVRRAHAGGRYVSDALAQILADGVAGAALPGEGALAPREREVLALFGEGLGLQQIGARLGLSPKTVSTYRARLLEKLDLHSTAELIRFALTHAVRPEETP